MCVWVCLGGVVIVIVIAIVERIVIAIVERIVIVESIVIGGEDSDSGGEWRGG